MWVTIYDSFTSNLGIDDNWNPIDSPWLLIIPSLFFLYVESLICNPKSSIFSYTDYIHIVIQQSQTAESEALNTTLPNQPLTLLQHPETTQNHANRVSIRMVYCIRRFIFIHYLQQTLFEPIQLQLLPPSPRSQLYPLSKSCKIHQHSSNPVPHSHHLYAWTRGILNCLWRSLMQGRS